MNKKDLKILYFGTPDISAVVLERLITNSFNIVGVISQVDKEVNRKGQLLPTKTKEVALKYGVNVYQPLKINEFIEEIRQIKPDIILTLAYGQIIPEEILNIPTFKALNLHGSILPKYRGAAPIQYSLLNGDLETGVSLMEMVKKMDAGRVFAIEKFAINNDDNYSSLKIKIAEAAYKVFDENIEDVVNEINKGVEQDENLVTFTSKIDSSLERINFNKNGVEIINLIRALTDEPGTYFMYKNEKIKVFKADFIKKEQISEVSVICGYDKNGLLISSKDGLIKITKLQKPGKKVLNISDFYNGNKDYFEIGVKIE